MKTVKFDKDAARVVSNQFVADISGIIYNGLVHKLSRARINGKIRDEISWYKSKLGRIPTKLGYNLWKICNDTYRNISKQADLDALKRIGKVNYQQNVKERSIKAYEALKTNLINTNSVGKVCTAILNSLENDAKTTNLDNMLLEAREKPEYSPFFLASAHDGCAGDHVKYQGKVYYDANWRGYVDDKEKMRQIEAFIHNHRCMSVQEVTGRPHYFITRPNCHHFLKPITMKEALSQSARSLLKSKNLIVATNVKTFPGREYSRAYRDRLTVLTQLWKVMPNDSLAHDLKEMKMNYSKWIRIVS